MKKDFKNEINNYSIEDLELIEETQKDLCQRGRGNLTLKK